MRVHVQNAIEALERLGFDHRVDLYDRVERRRTYIHLDFPEDSVWVWEGRGKASSERAIDDGLDIASGMRKRRFYDELMQPGYRSYEHRSSV